MDGFHWFWAQGFATVFITGTGSFGDLNQDNHPLNMPMVWPYTEVASLLIYISFWEVMNDGIVFALIWKQHNCFVEPHSQSNPLYFFIRYPWSLFCFIVGPPCLVKSSENPVYGSKTENRIYFFGNRFLNLFFCHFRKGNCIKITKCRIKLVHTFV